MLKYGGTVTGQSNQLLFKVIDGDREYEIFASGETKGFGSGARILNYFPLLVRKAEEEVLGRQNFQHTRESDPKDMAVRMEPRHKQESNSLPERQLAARNSNHPVLNSAH